MSILSREPDGLGFYYGFATGDRRQVNVWFTSAPHLGWIARVGGESGALILVPAEPPVTAESVTTEDLIL